MRKVWIVAWVLCLMLVGCKSEETLETVSDVLPDQPVLGKMREISVTLPDSAVSPVLSSEAEQVYLSEDYEIVVETRASGDLKATVEHMSGFDADQLTLVKTSQDGAPRYDFVWACAGEAGERLGRGVILDDGNYHYCLSVLRDADGEKSQVIWSEVFSSFRLDSY